VHPINRASFNLTRECNLTCSFCFTNGCTHGSMSEEIAFRAVDFLFDGASKCQGRDRVVEVNYWGGEPLLKWELIKRVTLYAKSVSEKLSIPVNFGGTTNATLLTPEKFDFLDEHKIFFLLSIDGGKDSHDLFRKFKNGTGSHDLVIRNAKQVLKKWPFYRARVSLTADRVDHFFEDMTYLNKIGFNYLVFSPVYEGDWIDEKWDTFIEQGKMLIDYISDLRKENKNLIIEHFRSYCTADGSPYPCGAGRFYVDIGIDGAIYPCHRFNKFNDERDWRDKEFCIGHIDHGITRPEFRDKFINFDRGEDCLSCERLKDTVCNGGCYGIRYDFTKDINTVYQGLCKYTNAQKRVSDYFKEKLGGQSLSVNLRKGKPCICYNMCYLEDTVFQKMMIDGSGLECMCYQANYTGDPNPALARPVRIDPNQIINLIQKQDNMGGG